MQVTGTIKLIKPTESIGDRGFKKREFVVHTEEQYPQDILIELVQDKCELLNNYAEGQKVTVSINLRGREWTNAKGEVKYFNTIQGWRIENVSDNETTQTTSEPQSNSAQDFTEEDHDELPF